MDCPLLAVVGDYTICRHTAKHVPAGVIQPSWCDACGVRDLAKWPCPEPRPLPTLEEIATALASVPRPPAPADAADHAACRHRGEKLRDEKCRLCSRRERIEPVFACAIHGQCTERRFKSGRGPVTCLGCENYETNRTEGRQDRKGPGAFRSSRPLRPSVQKVVVLSDIAVGVITAPREVPTLAGTIDSLRAAGFSQPVRVFAEPGSELPGRAGVAYIQRPRWLGLFGNWLGALEQLVDTDARYVLVCEDDVEFSRHAAARLLAGLRAIPERELGYASLYTPRHNADQLPPNDSRALMGWRPIPGGARLWGALAWCFPAEVARRVVQAFSPVTPERQGTDVYVSAMIQRLGLGCWSHFPSLAAHTGLTSTVGHRPNPAHAAVGFYGASVPSVGFLMPDLPLGGVARLLADTIIASRLNFSGIATRDGPMWRPYTDSIRERCPVFGGTWPVAAQAVIDGSDVLVTWGLTDEAAFHGLDFGGRPVVVQAHGEGLFTQRMIAAAAGVATHRMAVSSGSAAMFDDANVFVLPGGVDPTRCLPRRSRAQIRRLWNVPEGATLLGYVGRIACDKHPLAVTLAAAELGEAYRAVLVGDGQHPHIWHAQSESLGCGRAVIVPPVEHVGDALGAIDVLVACAPSEGGPLCVVEAWMSGVPVVATRVGAIPAHEAAAGRELIWAVPNPPRASELAAAVELARSAAGQERAEQARQYALQHATAAIMAAKFDSYIRAVESSRSEN